MYLTIPEMENLMKQMEKHIKDGVDETGCLHHNKVYDILWSHFTKWSKEVKDLKEQVDEKERTITNKKNEIENIKSTISEITDLIIEKL